MISSVSRERTIVVGSGIVGIACAHYLSKAGIDVTVIDRGTLANGCSYGNCGYICPSHVLPLTEPGAIREGLRSLFNPKAPFRVKPSFNPGLWKWMWQFAKRCHHSQMLTAGSHLKAILDSSMLEYRSLIAEENLDCNWKTTGLLYVLKTEHGMQEFHKTNQLLTEHFGVTAKQIDGSDLPNFDEALKKGLAGAFYYPDDASVRPDLLTTAWTHILKERGVQFIENCELLGVEQNSHQVTHAVTSQGKLPAASIVVATGAWSSQLSSLLKCHIPIQPGKGYSVTMQRPEICPQYPMLFPEHRVGVSPFEKGYRLGSMMEFAGFDTSIPESRIQQLKDSAKPYLVHPFTEGKQETWYGWRPMTWDSLPVIGPAPRLKNVYLATGHNMLGVSLATATGRLIAEMIQSQTPHLDPAPYLPDRFN